jgi:putative hydrolase of the HAD superfamily
MNSMSNITVIAFDADDTLWDNEIFFRESEDKFCALFEDFLPFHSVQRELLKVEIQNLALYGYGIKAFVLSMIETANNITNYTVKGNIINLILNIGKEMLNKPVNLLPGVEDVLMALHKKYKLVLATKGDLLDQERKLEKSKLSKYFHHIEIMTEKSENDYQKILSHLDIPANQFLMVGNSLKSDVLPVINMGGFSVHIPYHTTWILEQIDHEIKSDNFFTISSIKDLSSIIH